MVAAASAGRFDVLFLLGADELEMPRAGSGFVVYIGTHGDAGAHRADVILPGAAFTEKTGIWVNTEGRVQVGMRAAFPPGDAREDWSILRALSGALGSPLPFDSLAELRRRLYAAHPHMAEADAVQSGAPEDVMRLMLRDRGVSGPPFESPIRDFYLTNPIARASRVLAECSALQLGPALQAAE
jgi:NADH-quinone oxidoreductase subunit G